MVARQPFPNIQFVNIRKNKRPNDRRQKLAQGSREVRHARHCFHRYLGIACRLTRKGRKIRLEFVGIIRFGPSAKVDCQMQNPRLIGYDRVIQPCWLANPQCFHPLGLFQARGNPLESSNGPEKPGQYCNSSNP